MAAVLLALLLSACGGSGPAAAPTAPAPAPAVPSPSAAPTARPTSPPTVTSAPAQATATAAPAAATTVWVGNTDGEGVYLRKTPAMADRLQAYPDGTALEEIGPDVDGDGQHWHHVRAPDGTEGYVPAQYTVDTQP